MYQSLGITQKIMADMAHVNPSTINKIVASGSFTPLNGNVSRNIRYSISDTREIMKKALSKLPSTKMKHLSFYNFKGGVGKTTLCYQVASHLALMGFNVLAVDADPQGHLSMSFGFDTDDSFLTLYDVVSGDVPIQEVVRSVYPGLDCIPSNISLSRLETVLSEERRGQTKIADILSKIEGSYDYIIFDTNPTISHINRNITYLSDMVCVVVETQAYALNGLKILLNDLKNYCKSSSLEIPNLVIIPNKYEDRTAASGESMAVLRNLYSDYVIPDFAVRRSEELHTSGKISQPLAFFCRSNSIALEDVRDVIHYLLSVNGERKSAAAELNRE